MRKWIAILITLALLGSGRPARADSAPLIAAGPNLQPMNSTTVRMESEQIEISLRRAPGKPQMEFSAAAVGNYRIRFHFVPTADETMQAGFPLWVIHPQLGLWGAHITDFKAVVGGQVLPSETRFIPWEHGQQDWAVFALTFRKGEPLDLEVSYSLEVEPFGKGWGSDLWISYILQTGALWAGTIGHAEATVKLDRPIRQEDIRLPGQSARGTTPGWTLVDGALHWEWQDLEPDFNLSVQMANVYWLDTPDDLRALIAAGVKNRDDLLRIWCGTEMLYEGDGRSGLWEQVRGGSAEQVGEAFLPDVLKLLADYIQQNPQDTDMQGRYLRLLYDSSLHLVPDGYVMYNEGRYRTWLAESRKYRQATGRGAYGLEWFPWVAGRHTVAHLSDAGQAETAAVLLELMPARFPSEGGARLWAQQAAGGSDQILTGTYAQSLLDAALQRVAPDPAPEPPATPIGPVSAPAPTPEPVAPAAKPAPGWPIWAGAGLAFIAAAAGLAAFLRNRHKRR